MARFKLMSKWLFIAMILCMAVTLEAFAADDAGSGKRFFKTDSQQKTKMTFDRMELEVPVGAAEGELSVEMVEPDLTGINKPRGFRVVSKAYRFGPGGMKFAQGKELVLKIDLDQEIKNAKLYYIDRVNKCLEIVEDQGFDGKIGKLRVKVKHFSEYVLGITAAWDGSGINPFSDYITNGFERVQTYGHSEPKIRQNVYSVKGRGMDLDFTIASESPESQVYPSTNYSGFGIGSIAPGLKIDIPFFRKRKNDYTNYKCLFVNIPGKDLYPANYDARPTSTGTGSLAGWSVYNYNDSSFAVKVKESITTNYGDMATDSYFNIYESMVYLSDGRCIRDYGTYQTVTDLNGNIIKYTYHTKHYYVIISDDTGGYDVGPTKELIDTIEDTMGRMFYFSYNAEGNMTQIQQKLSDNSMKTIVTFSYSGTQLTITDAVGRAFTLSYNAAFTNQALFYNTSSACYRRLLGVRYPNGVRSEYSYGTITFDTGYSILSQKWYKPNQSTAFREVNYGTVSGHESASEAERYVSVKDGITKRDIRFSYEGSILTENVYSIATGKLLKTVMNKYITLLTVLNSNPYGSELLTSSTTTLYKSSDSSSGEAITWKYEYDNWGNITKITDPKNTVTIMAYANTNSNKSLVSLGYQDPVYTTGAGWNKMITKATLVKDPVHNTTQLKQTHYQYDAKGNLLQEREVYGDSYLNTIYTCDSYGNVLTKTDANGNKFRFEYSSTYKYAYPTRVYKPDTSQTIAAFAYDFGTGNKTMATDPKGSIYRYEYDAIGRLTKEYLDNSDTNISISRLLRYDDANNILLLLYGNASKGYQAGRIYYDPLFGKPTVLQRYNGLVSDLFSISTSGWATQKTFAYDSNGRLTTETDALGYSTTYAYDEIDRKTKITKPDATTTQFAYDDRTVTITDANGNVKEQTLDLLDRLVSVAESPSSGTTYTTAYTYDNFYDNSGDKPVYHLIKVNNPLGAATTYTYSNLGQLTRTDYPQDGSNPMTAETFTYDNVGNLVTKTNGKGTKSLTYEYFAGYRVKKVTEPDGRVVTYTYDANDNPLTQSWGTGYYEYTYDVRNQVKTMAAVSDGLVFRFGYDYDVYGRVTGITYPGRTGAVSYQYDTWDRLQTIPGFVNSCSYDLDNKLMQMVYSNGIAITILTM